MKADSSHSCCSVRQMPCPERVRLMDLYSKATRDMSEMVTALSDVAISYETDVFNRAWEHCERARRHCSDVRQQIYAHITAHRCALLLPDK